MAMGDARKRSRRNQGLGRGLALGLGLGVLATGCGRLKNRNAAPETQQQADRLVRKAIRSSSEGIIFMPSRRAEQVFELPRLNAVAQTLRQPAAWCFVQRAVETMRPTKADERGYDGIPEGQIKMRARIAPNGHVVSVEILETGFTDEAMPACLTRAVEKQRFPENRSGNIHHIDVVYWVSLGFQAPTDDPAVAQQRREVQVAAAVRAKECLQGRAAPGRYDVEGLNLVDREGLTIVNRVEASGLPDPVVRCIEHAFAQIRLPREPGSFVRPVAPRTTYEVGSDGTIAAEDEQWLELVRLEQRAKRELATQQLREGRVPEVEVQDLGPGPAGPEPALLVKPPEPDTEIEPQPSEPAPESGMQPGADAPSAADDETADRPPQDPGRPGLRLRLRGRDGEAE